jgi:hypothetical protein
LATTSDRVPLAQSVDEPSATLLLEAKPVVEACDVPRER